MLILKKPVVCKHTNPPLIPGRTYQLIEDDDLNSFYKAGRVFAYANDMLIWLASNVNNGGYDLRDVIVERGLRFVEVDLTLV